MHPRDRLALALALALAAAIATWALIVLLRPVLTRYALARPNARSSHVVPTPQGGGMAILISIVLVTISAAFIDQVAPWSTILVLVGAATALAIIGAADDIIVLPALPRLVSQLAAAIAILFTLDGARVLPLPPSLEYVVLVLAIVWFVNLVNFMDGIDWITVAEIVPITVGVSIIAADGEVSPLVLYVSLSISSTMIAFAPFNRPIAKLFLGDVGSLPIGLLVAWLLIQVAAAGHLVAALLLPLYYLADATITLVRRIARGERVWQAHRTHYYQRATERGRSVLHIVTLIFSVNIALAILAIISTRIRTWSAQLMLLATGIAIVGWLLVILVHPRRT